MVKHFKDISNDPINDDDLLRLNLHILILGYIEEGICCFTEIAIKDEDEEEQDKKPQVFNFLKEKIKQRAL